MRLLNFLFASYIIFFSINAEGQDDKKLSYFSAEGFTMVGKIMNTQHTFHRIDTTEYAILPKHIKAKLICGAGLAISFVSNSTSIHAKWCTNSTATIAGMTPIAYRGLDLYIKRNGAWQFAGTGSPKNNEQCSANKLIANLKEGEHEFLLYLPGYSEIQSLSIGIENNATINPGVNPFEKRILVYGSSIVQGAGASRPGLIYTSRLSRETGYNFLNLGMSGSAKMEKEVADMVSEIPADLYILDCVPNSHPDEIIERTSYLVKTIRKKRPDAPIIIMQSVIRESGYFDEKIGERVKSQNINIYNEFKKLQNEGVDNLHFIFSDNFLGADHEGTVDGTHPNDLGFDRIIQVIKPKILEVIDNKY